MGGQADCDVAKQNNFLIETVAVLNNSNINTLFIDNKVSVQVKTYLKYNFNLK